MRLRDEVSRHAHGQQLSNVARAGAPAVFGDQRIAESWRRSIEEHQVDPDAPAAPRILSAVEVRDHCERIDSFLAVARFGLARLHAQIRDAGYCVLMTDAEGTTVDFRGVTELDRDLRVRGFRLGACWSEHDEGTNGVGTTLVDKAPILVHRSEHFRAYNAGISCSAAPVFGPESDVVAVINASALTAPEDRRSQSIVFHLVTQHARLIENAFFLESNRHRWNLQLSRAGHGFEPEYLLALDDAGRIVQANVRARLDLLDRRGPLPVPLHAVFQASTEELMRAAFERPGQPMALRELSSGNCFSCIVRCPEVRPPARRKPDGRQGFAALVTEDARVAGDIQRIKRIVDSRLPILLLGETGVGKEAFARAIHLQSTRRDRPFVALNCAAIPENLIESELFGYREGAFTGAKQKGETGKIQLSSGGTLFLDEIGDMPLTLQTRLLRVLAEGEVLPLGGGEPEKVDLNVICATHRDVQQLVEQGRFREDLFYRLNAATFRLPALRERTDKREVLQQVFEAECVAAGRSLGLNADLIEHLLTYTWPGNIRQLRNSLRYAIAVCEADELALAHMPEQIVQALADVPAGTGNLALSSRQADERERMRDALNSVQWRVTDAALSLGIPRATFYRKMHRYGLLRAHTADGPRT